MAWDDPSPRTRASRPKPRDPGDLGELAANMQPGYGGIGRQGYGEDNATLGQLVGRSVASLALGGVVYVGVQFVADLMNVPTAPRHGMAAFAGLIVAALFMRNLSSGASRWGLADLFGWFVPEHRLAWNQPARRGWFARRYRNGDVYGAGYGPTFGEQAAVEVAVDAVEAAIDAFTSD